MASDDGRRQVLVFNNKKILIAVLASAYEAAKYGDRNRGNIARACAGDLISVQNYYFRYTFDSVEIEISDVGTLTLEEYDKLCGVTRMVYDTPAMNRKRWTYNKKNKQNEDNDKNL